MGKKYQCERIFLSYCPTIDVADCQRWQFLTIKSWHFLNLSTNSLDQLTSRLLIAILGRKCNMEGNFDQNSDGKFKGNNKMLSCDKLLFISPFLLMANFAEFG